MNRRELLARQKAIIKRYSYLYARQSNCSNVEEWHDCERRKQELLERCDRIRKLLEMGATK